MFCLIKSCVPEEPLSSGILKLIISTMLDTSFFIVSGRVAGICFPTILRLQRYMANANSGKKSSPDRVVSARVLPAVC